MTAEVRESDDAFAEVVSCLQEWVDAEFAAVVASWDEDDGGGDDGRCLTGASPVPGGTPRSPRAGHRPPPGADAGRNGRPGRRVRSPPEPGTTARVVTA